MGVVTQSYIYVHIDFTRNHFVWVNLKTIFGYRLKVLDDSHFLKENHENIYIKLIKKIFIYSNSRMSRDRVNLHDLKVFGYESSWVTTTYTSGLDQSNEANNLVKSISIKCLYYFCILKKKYYFWWNISFYMENFLFFEWFYMEILVHINVG